MIRFTIRDLFWLTAVVAIGVGWGVSNYAWLQSSHAAREKRVAIINHAEKLRTTLRAAKEENEVLQEQVRDLFSNPPYSQKRIVSREHRDVDWAVMNEPIPSP